VQGLPAGTYNVDVNGVQAEFTLAVDNTAANPAADATTASSGGGQTTSGVQETDVQYVMAQADVPIYQGEPGDTSTQVNFIAGGQMAMVTGVSADGLWWRVLCPGDVVGNCWVSADPQLTQPASAPGGEQTAPGVQETDVQYIMAQTDIPIYGGAPGDTRSQIGFVAGGQIAQVTGVSPDGAWWRVLCPDDSEGDCWVAADPSQTQPTTAP
jgi:hypothetical protein